MSRSAIGSCGILAGSLVGVLTGCVPIPYPIPSLGYMPDSRHNLNDAVPAFIVRGQTSREEVLYKLGEPDQVIGEGQTFVYVSAKARGGMGILVLSEFSNNMPVSEAKRMVFRRLTVEFDASGRVSSAANETKACTSESYSRDLFTEHAAPVSTGLSWGCPISPPTP